ASAGLRRPRPSSKSIPPCDVYRLGYSLEELHREIRDAVHCHFEEGQVPPLIRLHHVRQELLTL
ncbi:MAG: hypothetical protein ACKOPS_12260, partial [Cyanobium sp.]